MPPRASTKKSSSSQRGASRRSPALWATDDGLASAPQNTGNFLPLKNQADIAAPQYGFGYFVAPDGAVDPNAHNMTVQPGTVLNNGFLPKFRADGSTVMYEVDPRAEVQAVAVPLQQAPTAAKFKAAPKEAIVDDDVISITSSEDDGAKKTLPRDDSIYRGRAVSSGRVKSERAPSPVVTRSASKILPVTSAHKSSIETQVKQANIDNNAFEGQSLTKEGAHATPRSSQRPGKGGQRQRNRTIVDSSDEEVASHASEIPAGYSNASNPRDRATNASENVEGTRQESQRRGRDPSSLAPSPVDKAALKKRSRSVPSDRVASDCDNDPPTKRLRRQRAEEFDSDSSLPSIGEIFTSTSRTKRNVPKDDPLLARIQGIYKTSERCRDTFVEEDATAGDDSQAFGKGDEKEKKYSYRGKNLDKYDSEDSFIDDTMDADDEDGEEMDCAGHDDDVETSLREHRASASRKEADDRHKALAIARQHTMAESATSSRYVSDGVPIDLYEGPTPGKQRKLRFRDPGKGGESRDRQVVPSTPRRERGDVPMTPIVTPSGTANSPPPADDTPTRFQRFGRELLSTPTGRSAMPRTSANTDAPVADVRSKAVLPMVCEVNDPALHDPELAADYAPGRLPNLTAGTLIPWSDAPGAGNVLYSAWADHCPTLNRTIARDSISFSTYKHFINPSRAPPNVVWMKDISTGSQRMHAYIGEVPAIFTSAAFGEISRLRTLSTVGLRQKLLQAKLHSQEFQRASSTFCMVSGFRSLHANLARDSMHFVTRPLFRKEDRLNGSTSFPTPRRGMFTNARADADPTRVRADNFALDANAEVPIYNARAAVDFNFKENLVNIDSVLPRWNDEVPYGSFVVIAYTVAVYRANNGNWTLSCNIRWVMLVGVPEEDNSA